MVLETNESTCRSLRCGLPPAPGGWWRRQGLQKALHAGALAGLLLGLSGAGSTLAAPGAAEILRSKCGSCHLEAGKLQRITNLRKSPEGWDMTIARMGIWHKVAVTRDERKTLVKYLADRQGLAPEESATYRFLFERQPNAQDVAPNDELAQMCGRCHSYGRVALQRRDADEWTKLIHTHLGQFPSIEYSALGRDRNWRDIALGKTAGELAALYPRQTPAWKAWQLQQARQPSSAAGSWRVAGHRPGWGDYAGYMRVSARGGDRYDVQYELHYAAGNKVTGNGEAVLYTGYEWRGDARIGNQSVRSVFALSKDGARLAGRWFLREADEIGASFEAVRGDAVPRGTILSVQPALLRAGSTANVAVHGIQVGEQFDLGPGIRVLSAKAVSAHEAHLKVAVAADAPAGWRAVRAAGISAAHAERAAGRLAVYPQLDTVRVEPAFGIARVGGGSGTTAPQTAQFEAIAYLNGPDGQPGTDDDVRLGAVPATWSVDNHDEKAKAADDVRFAGVMEPHGQFLPSFAGPNPARKGLNNVGDLKVTATVNDGDRTLTADGRLVVTVQRWNTPPLR